MQVYWHIAIFSLSKKIIALAAGKLYGFPRIYRRFAEVNKRLGFTPEIQKRNRGYLATIMRAPNKITGIFQRK